MSSSPARTARRHPQATASRAAGTTPRRPPATGSTTPPASTTPALKTATLKTPASKRPLSDRVGPGRLRRLVTAVLPSIPAPIRSRLTAGRLLLADLVLLAGLLTLGCVQAFVLSPSETRAIAHALSPARSGYVDPYRSQDGNGHVWLTTAALVRVDRLHGGGSGERVLLDAPAQLRQGQSLTVYIAAGGHQVRARHLPGPPVLPRGQGAALIAALIALIPLCRRLRRQRDAARAAAAATTSGQPAAPAQAEPNRPRQPRRAASRKAAAHV